MEVLLFFVIPALVLGLIPAYMASERGRSFGAWYFYGVFLFFFAMIHAIIVWEQEDKRKLAGDAVLSDKFTAVPEPLLGDAENQESPVEIMGVRLWRRLDRSNVLLAVGLINLGEKPVQGVKLKISCFDSFAEPVGAEGGNTIIMTLQDLEVRPQEPYTSYYLQLAELADTRKVQVEVLGVLFADGTIWRG